jgi:two-component system, response regulator PdtaR
MAMTAIAWVDQSYRDLEGNQLCPRTLTFRENVGTPKMGSSKAKVLVLDDEPRILFSVADHLRDEGLEVVEALDASDALDALTEHPDVGAVIANMQLPGSIDGAEFTRIVNLLLPTLPVIVASGIASKGDMPPGVIFVPKPYQLEELSKLIKQLV